MMKIIFLVSLITLGKIALAHDCQASAAPQTRQAQWLKAHNDARAKKGVRPLRWDSRVAKSAKVWARHLAKSCRMQHEKNSGYGENLWSQYGYGGKLRPIEATVNSWLREEKFYDPKNPKWCSGGECRHYTQVMWSRSTALGCATAACGNKDKGYIRVCRYEPQGNFIGQKPY